jgi:hypothetical protein
MPSATKHLSPIDKESSGLRLFAYGSLVNLSTIAADVQVHRAAANGWVRQWRDPRSVDTGIICGLTISPRIGMAIDGLLLQGGQTFVDEIRAREADDLATTIRVVLDRGDVVEARTYVVPTVRARWADPNCPICLSYLDCILEGYLRLGPEAIDRFIETTEGWSLPLMNDRAAPRYPRPVKLSAEEKIAVDECLRKHKLL